MKTRTLCLVEKKHLRCDRCDLPLNVRTWKNEIIALSINKRENCGFLCVKCILNSKKNCTFYRTKKQLDEFLRKNLEEIIIK